MLFVFERSAKAHVAPRGPDGKPQPEHGPVAGRAPYFLIYEDGKLVKTIKNPFAVGGGGAGFAVAKMLKDENVDAVVAGHYGENMSGALKEKGVKRIELYNVTIFRAIDDNPQVFGLIPTTGSQFNITNVKEKWSHSDELKCATYC